MIDFVKGNVKLAWIKIILGGPDVKYNSNNLINTGADYVVVGEGEETSVELIKTLEKKDFGDLRNIKGIVYKDHQSKIIKTGEREKIKDLDSLHVPNRDKIDIEMYFNSWKKMNGNNSITISTMRGCPYTCKWYRRAVY